MLDEIGEMSPAIQAKFLRVLEGHPFERVGGSEPVKVDVRVIAATNRDLERDVAEGRFRRDLYFRLRVLEIVVPALRKRPEDIPVLADYFLQKFNAETGRKIHGFTPAATEQLIKYLWPGNVRELKNVIERAVVLCRGQEIGVEDLLLTKLATAGDTGDIRHGSRREVSARSRWTTWSAGTSWPRCTIPAGTRARRPPSWASSVPRSTARSAATNWKRQRPGCAARR